MSFSQLPAVEKDTEKWAAGKLLGPSYFEATLEQFIQSVKGQINQNPFLTCFWRFLRSD